MKNKRMMIIFIMIYGILLSSCHNQKNIVKHTKQPVEREILFAPGPPAIVYKTTEDYSDFVPVTMNPERTEIRSYPAPSDVYYQGKLSKPTPLKNGYWLDNRGINENVVFLNYTYESYSQLTQPPTMQQMMSNIKALYPLTELIHCGLRAQYKNEIKELNELIDGDFSGCERLKLNLTNTQF